MLCYRSKIMDVVYKCVLLLHFIVLASSVKDSMEEFKVTSVTFLVTVNDTWMWDPPIYNDTCMVTIKTDSLYPDMPLNESNINVGNCDHGPLVYSVNANGNKSSIFLTFHSSVIEDASPPTCTIDWDYRYRVPLTPGPMVDQDNMESLLPGCFVGDSREGYHMTYYWFYILDWSLDARLTPQPPQLPHALPPYKILDQPLNVVGISFLVAVNRTDDDCLATSKTRFLKPGPSAPYNKSDYIYVGKCDYGVLNFAINNEESIDGTTHTYIDLIFYSHDIEDAGPPKCRIQWDYRYQVPSDKNPSRSLLPGCYVMDSREGYHTTYYWFYVQDWMYG